jgi:hypothetical protein
MPEAKKRKAVVARTAKAMSFPVAAPAAGTTMRQPAKIRNRPSASPLAPAGDVRVTSPTDSQVPASTPIAGPGHHVATEEAEHARD